MPPDSASLHPAEPTLAALPNTALRYFLATRPAFLSVTLVGVLLGLASAHVGGIDLQLPQALLTLVFALVAHAGVNVLNDYYDAINGADAANTERVFPFTGGSRFIQNGVLTPRQTALFGFTLLGAVVPAGLWLALHSAAGLIGIGLAGLIVGWAYSAPPLKFVSRGLGEIAVAAGWVLIVVGSDYVQRGSYAFMPLATGLGFALLVANLLYINQFPDYRADAQAGKRTMVVRLGRQNARWGYILLALVAYVWLAANVAFGVLPNAALLAFLAAPLSLHAAHGLWQHAEEPAQLVPAIKLTIAAAHLYGLLLAAALTVLRGWLS